MIPPPTASSEGVPTPTIALIEGVMTGSNNQTSTQNSTSTPVTGEDSTPPLPSVPDLEAAQPAPTPSEPDPPPAPMPKPPRRSEHVTRPSWIKEAADKQKAKEAETKASRKARQETREARKQLESPPEPEVTPLEPTAMGNIAQMAYLAAHGKDIPQNFREATTGPDADQWWKAMNEEIAMLQKRGTWKLVDRPKGRKVIGSRWTYAIKYGPDGEILRYKARLVAQGYSQIPGVDYSDTFSPTVRLDSLRAILHFAAAHGWYRGQDDVTGAFLHSEIDHEIFMKQPEGFSDGSDKVAELLLSLYGIKQGSHLWNKYMHQKLVTCNFACLTSDHAVYTRRTAAGISITAIHVDNALTVASSKKMLAETRQALHDLFEMKEEDPNWLMGFKLIDNHKKCMVSISQAQYIDTVLKRFSMDKCNPVSTPMDPGLVLSKLDCPQTEAEKSKMAEYPYRKALGAITWLAIVSQPDLAHASSQLGQYSTNPGKTHWKAVTHVLRYLKGTCDLTLTLGRVGDANPDVLTGHTDASWADNVDDQ